MTKHVAIVLLALACVLSGCKKKPVYCHPTAGEIDAGDVYATLCAADEICGTFTPGPRRCCSPGRDPGCH